MNRSTQLLAMGALAALACAPRFSLAAEDTIATDRPDFVESTDVVGRGRVQIEVGVSSERNKVDGSRERLATTPTLIRMGIGEALELRVETDGYARSRVDDGSGMQQRERGMSDASLGLKWHQRDGDDKGSAALAWLVHLDIDSGSTAFRGQGLRPSLRAVAEWELSDSISLGLMPGVLVDKNSEGHRYAAGMFALTLGKALTPKWKTFIELAGQHLATKKNGGNVATVDTGVTYLVSDNLQLDLSVSRGITSHTPDWQWGLGLSVRF